MSNQKKLDTLGIPYGTAVNRLRKSVMFQLMQETEKDTCYRCGEKIENVDDLSIEHKEPWEGRPNGKELFYDLSNIAFSHLTCNTRAGEKPPRGPRTEHGTESRYNYGCRCSECREAGTLRRRKYPRK